MDLQITPLGDALGAEISGLDLSKPLDPKTVDEIKAAWYKYLVLLFRNQTLSEVQELELARYFGMPQKRPRSRENFIPTKWVQFPETMLVSNIREDGKIVGSLPDGEMEFHTDGCYSEITLGYTLLYAMEIPSEGGDTLFLNMCAAYDALPPSLKAKVEGRKAVNAYHYGTTQSSEDEDYAQYPHYAHPIVRVHPVSGRKGLYVNRLMTREIEGMDKKEGRAILKEIFDFIEQDRFIYAHKWTPGDLLAWDNRMTLHARTDFSDKERRMLRRIATEGEKSIGATQHSVSA